MTERVQTTVLNFQGGYATDLAPQVRQLTFLQRAENIIYEVSGAVRKVGGTLRVNSTALSSAPSILGCFDFWRAGTGGTFTQRFVLVTSDSRVFQEPMDGVYADITGTASITANAIPVFCQARDLLTLWFSTNDTPLRWNQTGNVATLGGSPPAGRGAVWHGNRVWTWGDNANPSRLTYGSSTSVEDYTGADTGTIDIDPEDGDRIVGAVSHKRRLIVFKGPNKGSIHVISGTAPTGTDAYARTSLARGLPLQTHNSIIEVMDDVWFLSDRAAHSLSATERFGDFAEAFLTRYLRGYFRNDVNRGRFSSVWGVNYGHLGSVIWTMTQFGSVVNDQALGLSYIRVAEEGLRPFVWNRSCQSAAIRINPTTSIRELVFGDNAGFVNRQDVRERSLAGTTAYSMRVQTPDVILAGADSQGKPRFAQPVTLYRAYMRSRSVGNWNVTMTLRRDNNAAETYTFNQGTAGFLLGTDILGTGRLGGDYLQVATAELVGEARSINLDITQGGLNEDANLHEVGIEWVPAATSGASSLA